MMVPGERGGVLEGGGPDIKTLVREGLETLPQAAGLLGLHLQTASLDLPHHIRHDDRTFIPAPLHQTFPGAVNSSCFRLWVRVRIDRFEKWSRGYEFPDGDNDVNFDEVFYFTVNLDTRRSAEENNIKIDLMCTDQFHLPKVIGHLSLSLYDVVTNIVLRSTTFALVRPNTASNEGIGQINVEAVFSYGELGYGHSSVLQLPSAAESLHFSMFHRPEPQAGRLAPGTKTCGTRAVGRPVFLGELCSQQGPPGPPGPRDTVFNTSPGEANRDDQFMPGRQFIRDFEPEFRSRLDSYRRCSTRHQRLDYIWSLFGSFVDTQSEQKEVEEIEELYANRDKQEWSRRRSAK